jgi:hypothetical protein
MSRNKHKLRRVIGGQERKDVETLVFRIFLKHVKMHHLYPQFRCSVNISNRHRDLFHTVAFRVLPSYNELVSRLQYSGSAFSHARSLDELLSLMRTSMGVGKIENNGKCQMRLMNLINSLIHSCIEYSIRQDFQILEALGEGIFNEVCHELFGDSFVDKTQEELDPRLREMIEKYGRMPPPQMMGRMPRGDYRPTDEKVSSAFRMWMEEHLKQQEMRNAVQFTAEPQIYQFIDDVYDAPF